MTILLISGCGVSAQVSTKEGAEFWVNRILERGGIPTICILADGANNGE